MGAATVVARVLAKIEKLLDIDVPRLQVSALLVRWLRAPSTRPCSLDDLLVVSAQTGDEYEDTQELVETHILPLLREYNVRYVQVARKGPVEADGIVVLDDTRQLFLFQIH